MTPKQLDAKTANATYDIFFIEYGSYSTYRKLYRTYGRALSAARCLKRDHPTFSVELYGRRYGCTPDLLDIGVPLRDMRNT